MSRYAAGTEVPPEKSRMEIEATLKRYGADQFVSGWSDEAATIGFRIKGIFARLTVTIPPLSDFAKVKDARGIIRVRTPLQQTEARDQAERQRWRAMLLLIKAKLEAVELGLVTLEQAFLADILIGDGQTFGEWARPQLEQTYRTGLMPPSLPGLPSPAVERPRIVTAEVVEP